MSIAGRLIGGILLGVGVIFLLMTSSVLIVPWNDEARRGLQGGLFLTSFFGIPGALLYRAGRRAKKRDDEVAQMRGFVATHDAFTAAELAAAVGWTEADAQAWIMRTCHEQRMRLLFHRSSKRFWHPDRIQRAHQVISSCPSCGSHLGTELVFVGESIACRYCGISIAAHAPAHPAWPAWPAHYPTY